MTPHLSKKITEAETFLTKELTDIPKIAIVLGSGLAYFADNIQSEKIIDTDDIPHYPTPTVSGHQGKVILGKVGETRILAVKGRSHYYEGKTLDDVTFYVHLFKKLGIETIILTNAAGGVNPNFAPGDFVLINNFINFGQVDLYGVTDYSNLLSESLQRKALSVAKKNDVNLKQGTYCWTTGPSFETAAEVKAIQKISGDLAGMSTLPEAVVAHQVGLKVLGMSLVTNLAAGISKTPLTHEEVKETADKIKEPYYHFMKNVINSIN